ncbi:MAG TPA: dihydrofolate reductase [Clostridium sp.]|jgi:dihydrofolate reductase|uniref:Dihydrofolate reductase n=1 Tax=Clostridium lapidicellarium TaxID=3240931 RepID=A0ABV4DY27_9CLOT|nr:dihydrofolate reductase [uncultured Clostridium sp.]NLU09116.1 dihydrofolate reductase [Clostridiales bacterium]HBC96584.1 dihydrofolate reductase [Clostridium sp.]
MISLIAAINKKRVIGKDNKLIWHIPDDLKRFKKLTSGKTIIMGRMTFESLPKILPNRKHIVITRNKNYFIPDSRAEVVHNIRDIIKYKYLPEEVFIIGGEKIYRQMLPYCGRMYLTQIMSSESGDTYFPEFNTEDYKIIKHEKHHYNSIEYDFFTLERKLF